MEPGVGGVVAPANVDHIATGIGSNPRQVSQIVVAELTRPHDGQLHFGV